ncbi:uncharacterized protein LOC125384277 isoform X1 [Haliotis rufescens]|uniref:uncharacterized protein LOC125384277 isoform X1 n=1 Tax=Haliotis rufescens TaxID=6454 RepID=UPI00201FA3F7|nr:uncharacterized protein LOC125384277 isoform X1 [Haliotis rufescens]
MHHVFRLLPVKSFVRMKATGPYTALVDAEGCQGHDTSTCRHESCDALSTLTCVRGTCTCLVSSCGTHPAPKGRHLDSVHVVLRVMALFHVLGDIIHKLSSTTSCPFNSFK